MTVMMSCLFWRSEVLHVLSANKDARHEAGLLESGVIEGVFLCLGMSATCNSIKAVQMVELTFAFGHLTILHYFVADLGRDLNTVLASPLASAFIEVVAREPRLLKAFCSTLLVKTAMKIPRLDTDGDAMLDVPTLYGPPLVLVKETCSGFKDTHISAMNPFFTIIFLSSALDDSGSDFVWETICWKNSQSADSRKLTATLCAHFLKTLTDDKESPFLPLDTRKRGDFSNIARPLVLHSLLVELKESMGQHME
jgi:hypothetical protein